MAKRHISIDFDFPPDEPSEAHAARIRQVFGGLGWTVTQYGGGSSNVHRGSLDIESEDGRLDHPTLVAILKKLDIPLTEDTFTHTNILGDVSMERRSLTWAQCREADIADVHVEILGAAPAASIQWKDRRIPCIGVRCNVSPRGPAPLKTPLCIDVTAIRDNGRPLGGFATLSGAVWHPGERVFDVPVEEVVANVDLLVRILDIHRAGEVVFRSIPVL
jgi:hypothetical protein